MSVRLINGDCREVLRTLPDASVQCCVTSPPYFGLRSYLDSDHTDKCLEIGTERTPDEYVAALVDVFMEVKRVLRPDGVCFVNLGDGYAGYHGNKNHVLPTSSTNGWTNGYNENGRTSPVGLDGIKPKDLLGIPWRVAFALQADGWWLRSAIVWHKPNPMPESCTDRPTSSYEMVFLLSRRPTYFYDADAIRESCSETSHGGPNVSPGNKNRTLGKGHATNGLGKWTVAHKESGRNARNVWTIASQPFSGAHFATMPPDLAEKCIKAGTSEAGACPHCGAPWERIVEKGEPDREHQIACGGSASDGGYNGTALKDYASAGVQNASDVKRRILEGMRTKRTTGWRQTCSCPEHAPRPCVVLDPFAGSGTTGMVADRLGRDAVLIELKQDGLAQNRITQDCPLFAEVVA